MSPRALRLLACAALVLRAPIPAGALDATAALTPSPLLFSSPKLDCLVANMVVELARPERDRRQHGDALHTRCPLITNTSESSGQRHRKAITRKTAPALNLPDCIQCYLSHHMLRTQESSAKDSSNRPRYNLTFKNTGKLHSKDQVADHRSVNCSSAYEHTPESTEVAEQHRDSHHLTHSPTRNRKIRAFPSQALLHLCENSPLNDYENCQMRPRRGRQCRTLKDYMRTASRGEYEFG